jgi:hypothetical protein
MKSKRPQRKAAVYLLEQPLLLLRVMLTATRKTPSTTWRGTGVTWRLLRRAVATECTKSTWTA